MSRGIGTMPTYRCQYIPLRPLHCAFSSQVFPLEGHFSGHNLGVALLTIAILFSLIGEELKINEPHKTVFKGIITSKSFWVMVSITTVAMGARWGLIISCPFISRKSCPSVLDMPTRYWEYHDGRGWCGNPLRVSRRSIQPQKNHVYSDDYLRCPHDPAGRSTHRRHRNHTLLTGRLHNRYLSYRICVHCSTL